MTDADIVTLYWARDEQAIAQTAQKFGAYCRKIAMNLLGSQEDAKILLEKILFNQLKNAGPITAPLAMPEKWQVE